jgi:3-hydroxyisobutyrate dehydrogenase-like beta-hydroxyacid dehydrogenase
MAGATSTAPKAACTGMIGLGAMGLQMARHMAEKGFPVAGYDILPEAIRRAGEHGVTGCGSAAEVGRHADIVVVMVQTDAQVVEVVAESGLLQELSPGAVICIASSVAPDTCRRMEALAAARGVGVLDTPVVLGQRAADEGTLTVLAGGEEKWLETARPVLSAFGKHILHVGPSGHGQIAKTVNNMLLWACMCANFEALTLARELGADIPRLIEALGYSSGANWSLSRWGQGTGKWAEKDMDVALDLAQAAKVPLPLAGLVDQLMKTINQERMKALLG